MIRLAEKNIRAAQRQSSKGNQLKWEDKGFWYKADYMGYEGLAEYVVSSLLKYSDVAENMYIRYQTEEIFYKRSRYLGCKSRNFLPEGWQLITLERLFQSNYGRSLYKSIFMIQRAEERAAFLKEGAEQLTGLKDFGAYLSCLLTVDALFLNEDRHMHNIGVLLDEQGQYHYCPIFDNGCALLSDTRMDYPLEEDIIELIPQVKSKTLSVDFDEQLDAVENLYGYHIHFSFGRHEIERVLEEEPYYSREVKSRVREILLRQRRKYQYLFV